MENVEKIIQVKQGFGDAGCKSFVPRMEMLKKFNSVQLYDKFVITLLNVFKNVVVLNFVVKLKLHIII